MFVCNAAYIVWHWAYETHTTVQSINGNCFVGLYKIAYHGVICLGISRCPFTMAASNGDGALF